MADLSTITVQVHLDIDLNDEPITHVLEMPASMEPMEKNGGLTVHLHLDGKKLARALAPYIARELPGVVRNATDTRSF